MIVRFSRIELKYLLPRERCEPLIEELAPRTQPDPHGGRDGYAVLSLYYDSPEHECFWAKIDGLRCRRKLRIRVYPEPGAAAPGLASVEIKQRLERTVHKRRVFLPLSDAEALCAGQLPLSRLAAEARQVAEEVTHLSRSLALRPTALTAYQRRAYEGGRQDPGLRITLDTSVAARMHALDLRQPAANRLILPEDWCILEVKADERVPHWLASLLARHGSRLGRVSKYCTALALLRPFDVLPLARSPLSPLPGLSLPKPPHG